MIALKNLLPSGPFAIAIAVLACLALAGCDDDVVNVEDGPPAVPTGVTTITGDESVEVLWYPVRQDDVAGYGVYRSDDLDGPYERIATVTGVENTSYTDNDVTNGETYFYAVDAFDAAGHESDLSYEDAFDTPRPAGAGIALWALESDPTHAGLDWSDWDRSSFVTAWNAADADIYVHRVGGLLFAKGTIIAGLPNDIQDLGWTASMDDISWAPGEGWSVAPNGVELIEGHTYVVWTHDSYYAKFRVASVMGPAGTPSHAVVDWAYQIDPDNPELVAQAQKKTAVAPEKRT